MEINMQGGARMAQALPGARSVEFPVTIKTETTAGTQVRVPEAVQYEEAAVDARRFERVERAAQQYFKDIFAVSDARFTIYKDTSGQYITRYTSLRDGKVTYIPEPNMLQYMERKMQAREALLEIQA